MSEIDKVCRRDKVTHGPETVVKSVSGSKQLLMVLSPYFPLSLSTIIANNGINLDRACLYTVWVTIYQIYAFYLIRICCTFYESTKEAVSRKSPIQKQSCGLGISYIRQNG